MRYVLVTKSEGWREEVIRFFNARIRGESTVTGGDINEARLVTLDDGRRLFVKTNPRPPARMFEAEAQGLAFLKSGLDTENPLVVPEVLYSSPRLLVLEAFDRSEEDQSEKLGRGLAQLHRAPLKSWGAERPNFIGTLPQLNEPTESWVDFYRERRLKVQLALPGAKRWIDSACRRQFERLFLRLPEVLPDELPARLHGDLWGGNSFFTTRGPALFDPAAYGGHREVDLAMMRLFGGFSPRVYDAYEESYSTEPGLPERTFVYQLYPLLVHVNLFGGGYVAAVQDALRRVT